MNTKRALRLSTIVGLLISVTVTTSHAQDGPRYSHTGKTIITGVRVIDGLGNDPKENQDILIADGQIAAIGRAGSIEAPDGALKIASYA